MGSLFSEHFCSLGATFANRCSYFAGLRKTKLSERRRNFQFMAVHEKRKEIFVMFSQGWRQGFSDGGLTLPTRELNYCFQGTINGKNLRKNRVSPSDGGLACSDGGL